MTQRDMFRQFVSEYADKARAALPACNGRIDAAVQLVLSGDVELLDDHNASVASGSDASKRYTVNGSCPCRDFPQAPSGWCKHKIAAAIERRVVAALLQSFADTETQTTPTEPSQEPPAPVVPEAPETESPSSDTAGAPDAPRPMAEGKNEVSPIPAQYVTLIQGKPFIKLAGLLAMAHERGLVSLSEAWTYNDAELSLAHAVATFADGRTFSGCGDATTRNVQKALAPHFRRIACARAKARALRDALNIAECSVEEMSSEE